PAAHVQIFSDGKSHAENEEYCQGTQQGPPPAFQSGVVLTLLQQAGDLGSVWPRRWILAVHARNEKGKPGRDGRIHPEERHTGRVTEGAKDRQWAAAGEGGSAAAHGVEHAAQAEQIAAGIDGPSLGLLGRHVERRSSQDIRLRDVRIVLLDKAEVGE